MQPVLEGHKKEGMQRVILGNLKILTDCLQLQNFLFSHPIPLFLPSSLPPFLLSFLLSSPSFSFDVPGH